MATVTKSVVKTTTAQGSTSKGKAKPTAKPTTTTTTAVQFSIVAYIVAYIDAALKSPSDTYYHAARSNHKKQNTVFPRERNNATRLELLKCKDKEDAAGKRVQAVFQAHVKGLLKSGNGDGQAVYDIYRMNAK